MAQRISTKQKAEVKKRARNLCEYCRSPASYATQVFSVEHINRRQKGGDNLSENLAFACQGCNSHKHTKVMGLDPLTSKRVRCTIRASSAGATTSPGATTSRASSA